MPFSQKWRVWQRVEGSPYGKGGCGKESNKKQGCGMPQGPIPLETVPQGPIPLGGQAPSCHKVPFR